MRSAYEPFRLMDASKLPALMSLAEALPHPLLLLDPDLRFLWANAAAGPLLAGGGQELTEQTLEELGLRQLHQLLLKVRASPTDVQDQMLEVHLPGEGARLYCAAVFPVDLGEGHGWGCVLTDETGRSRRDQMMTREHQGLNDRLDVQARQLTDLNAELSDFLTSMAYDMQEPLRRIQGFLGLLQDHTGAGLDEKGLHYLSVARHEIETTSHLVSELTWLQQFLRHEFRPATVSLAGLVRQVRSNLEPQFGNRTIQWSVTELPEIQGDPQLLRQVLTVLLHNAANFTRGQPEARITVWSEHDERGHGLGGTVLCIQDNGEGFSPAVMDQLFQLFGRLHDHRFEGAGLGLAAVRRIMLRHGGHIWAQSQEGQGSVFRLRFPRTVPVTPEDWHPALDTETPYGTVALSPGEARQITQMFSASLHQADISIIITDAQQRIVYVNPTFCQLTGYRSGEVLGHNPRFLQGERTNSADRARLREGLSQGQHVHQLILNYHKDGRPLWFNMHISPLRERGRLRYFVALQEDATERVAQQTQVEWAAAHDQLTGLRNRHGLEGALRSQAQAVQPFALLVFDLDLLKRVNDIHGHAAGDQVIRRMADLLTAHARPGDQVFRLGGDEFLVLLPDMGEEGARLFAVRIQELFRNADDHPLRMDVSVGFALYPEEGSDVQHLIRLADERMYRQKSDRRHAGPP